MDVYGLQPQSAAPSRVGRAKLHARDRTQLVVLAYEAGVVTPGWMD
ncbi:hypothetical protein [Streptosporangium sp. NPDC003464]